ncbi:class I adenylate-forming enzyme family protein [Phycisphaerales bacterium AB-hyl4]|uniref:Class I adenylate-forming enzyme family protein n=1 Tax=Natronomicrosphaera hydrolytica TaxID=3242702 RepID=A0ABV4U243_9BACT
MSSILARQLQSHARSRPDAVAVRLAGEGAAEAVLTWGQWAEAAAALAARLHEQTTANAVVLVGIGNHPAFHVALMGVLLADRRAMAMAPDCAGSEIAAAATRTNAEAAIGTEAFVEHAAMHGLRCVDRDELIDATAADAQAVWSRHQGDGAVLLSSSGTTGRPKIVQRGTGSLGAVGESCARGIGFQADDTVLLTIPVHHSYGLEHGLLAPLVAGTRVELVASFDAERVLARLLAGEATIFPSVPFIFEALAQAHARAGAGGLAIRRAYSAGGPLPTGVYEAWQGRLGVRLGQLYGSTEIGSVSFNDPDEPGFDPTSVGRALPGATLVVLDRETPSLNRPLGAGEQGRVAVASGGMMSCYVDQPSDELVDGYFMTNDVGWLDDRGRLTLAGRLNLLIDIDGRKVNPAEVEAVLAAHEAVAEAVVLPMRMTETMNRLKAVVVPRAGMRVDTNELRQFARGRLSGHKLPRVYEVRESLPRSATGKVLREALLCS